MSLVLERSQFLRFAVFTLFYMAQGLPIGLISIALPAYLAGEGVSGADIGEFVAVTGLPWAFKLLAGPVMDRFSFVAMGRRRPWVLAAQSGLLIAALSLALVPDPVTHLGLLTALCFAFNLFAAVQDVAVDGMAIDLLQEDERGRANAFMAFGQVTGYSGSAAVCAFALVNFGLTGTAMVLAIGVFGILMAGILVRERPGEKMLPWSEGKATPRAVKLLAENWVEIFRDLLRVMFLPAGLLLMATALAWRFCNGFWITIAPLIATQELGYASETYSNWSATVGFISASLGLLFGWLIDRQGSQRVLVAGLLGYAAVYFVAGLNPERWEEQSFVLAILFGEAFTGQIVFISFIAIHMNVCWQKVAATQFAIYMAWTNLSRSIGAGVYSGMADVLDYQSALLLGGSAVLLAAGLAAMVRLESHSTRLASLDRMEA